MSYQIILIGTAVLAAIIGSGDCMGFCRSKLALPPLAVPGLGLPFSFGVPAEPVSNCGPEPLPLPIIQAPPLTVPTIQGPIIPLPSPPIPCPKTIGHKCICTKTVVKPQLIQRHITVPTIQRYLKRTYTPVVENIAYKAKPKCPPCGAAPACACGARPVCACGARPVVAAAPPCAPPPMPLAFPFSRIC